MSDHIKPSIGDRIKGAIRTVHATGEIARGMINGTLDGLGDGVAQRNSNEVQPRSNNTLEKGKEELARGMQELRGEKVAAPFTSQASARERSPPPTTGVFGQVENYRLKFNSTLDSLGDQLVGKKPANDSASSSTPIITKTSAPVATTASSVPSTSVTSDPAAIGQSFAQQYHQPTGWQAPIVPRSSAENQRSAVASSSTITHSVPPPPATSASSEREIASSSSTSQHY